MNLTGRLLTSKPLRKVIVSNGASCKWVWLCLFFRADVNLFYHNQPCTEPGVLQLVIILHTGTLPAHTQHSSDVGFQRPNVLDSGNLPSITGPSSPSNKPLNPLRVPKLHRIPRSSNKNDLALCSPCQIFHLWLGSNRLTCRHLTIY